MDVQDKILDAIEAVDAAVAECDQKAALVRAAEAAIAEARERLAGARRRLVKVINGTGGKPVLYGKQMISLKRGWSEDSPGDPLVITDFNGIILKKRTPPPRSSG